MSHTLNVKVGISGRISDDYNGNIYEILKAEIKSVCAKHNLVMNEFIT